MTMDVEKILAEARAERAAVKEAIITLAQLAQGRRKRRGRPPTWLAEIRAGGRSSDDAPAPSKKKGK